MTFSLSHYHNTTGEFPRGKKIWTFKFSLPYKEGVEERTPGLMSWGRAKIWARYRAGQLGSYRIEVLP